MIEHGPRRIRIVFGVPISLSKFNGKLAPTKSLTCGIVFTFLMIPLSTIAGNWSGFCILFKFGSGFAPNCQQSVSIQPKVDKAGKAFLFKNLNDSQFSAIKLRQRGWKRAAIKGNFDKLCFSAGGGNLVQ